MNILWNKGFIVAYIRLYLWFCGDILYLVITLWYLRKLMARFSDKNVIICKAHPWEKSSLKFASNCQELSWWYILFNQHRLRVNLTERFLLWYFWSTNLNNFSTMKFKISSNGIFYSLCFLYRNEYETIFMRIIKFLRKYRLKLISSTPHWDLMRIDKKVQTETDLFYTPLRLHANWSGIIKWPRRNVLKPRCWMFQARKFLHALIIWGSQQGIN